jgi:hypothetical protein
MPGPPARSAPSAAPSAALRGAPGDAPGAALSATPGDEDRKALAAYRKNPRSPDALFDHCFSLMRLDRREDARKVLSEWERAAPADPRIRDARALLERLDREPDRARRRDVIEQFGLEQFTDVTRQIEDLRRKLEEAGRPRAAASPSPLPSPRPVPGR